MPVDVLFERMNGEEYVTTVFTIKELADVLNIHYRTAQKMVSSGRVKSIRFNGTIRIKAEEIARLLEDGLRRV